jgi:2-oxo-4-hydroxy-4-carboxy--5-ureidoimidazoline (OHCU) decarboxylase
VISLQELNSLPARQFVAALAGIFERTGWVAERVAALRPFRSRFELQRAMCAAVEQAAVDEQLALIRAHPELAAKQRPGAGLTPESARDFVWPIGWTNQPAARSSPWRTSWHASATGRMACHARI